MPLRATGSWPQTRSYFPVTRALVHLDHAGAGPISTRVQEALREWSERALRGGAPDAEVCAQEVVRARSRVAALLGAQTHEISLVRNASEALGLVATGLSWRTSDVVVAPDRPHPSILQPWLALGRFGVEVQRLRTRADGGLDLDEIGRRLESPRVRLLCLASVDDRTGLRHDLAAIGALCRERGVLFCVDASQSLGCLPLSPERCGIDFLAAGGHRWLLAGAGSGLLYCADRVYDRLRPRLVGWHNLEEPEALEREQHELRRGGARFEPGTPDHAAAFRLGAAIDLLLELGIEAIAERVTGLRARLDAALDARGIERASPSGEAGSGIASFRLRHETATETCKRLEARRLHVAVRGNAVRASPHFYTAEAEIDELVAAL